MPVSVHEPLDLTVGTRLPLRLTAQQMMQIFAIEKSHFYALVAAGEFDHFELKPRLGRRAWSGALVQQYLERANEP